MRFRMLSVCFSSTSAPFTILVICTFYCPQPIRAVGYFRARCRLSDCPTVRPNVRPSRDRYYSTAHKIQHILFIFGTSVNLSRSMDPIDYVVSMFICWDLVALWNFVNTLTDLLPGLGRQRVPVLWTIFCNILLPPHCIVTGTEKYCRKQLIVVK